jgi:hypothetical protein
MTQGMRQREVIAVLAPAGQVPVRGGMAYGVGHPLMLHCR